MLVPVLGRQVLVVVAAGRLPANKRHQQQRAVLTAMRRSNSQRSAGRQRRCQGLLPAVHLALVLHLALVQQQVPALQLQQEEQVQVQQPLVVVLVVLHQALAPLLAARCSLVFRSLRLCLHLQLGRQQGQQVPQHHQCCLVQQQQQGALLQCLAQQCLPQGCQGQQGQSQEWLCPELELLFRHQWSHRQQQQ